MTLFDLFSSASYLATQNWVCQLWVSGTIVQSLLNTWCLFLIHSWSRTYALRYRCWIKISNWLRHDIYLNLCQPGFFLITQMCCSKSTEASCLCLPAYLWAQNPKTGCIHEMLLLWTRPAFSSSSCALSGSLGSRTPIMASTEGHAQGRTPGCQLLSTLPGLNWIFNRQTLCIMLPFSCKNYVT